MAKRRSLNRTSVTSVFDYTLALEGLLRDMCERSEVFSHVDMGRVLVMYSQCRRSTSYGIYAKVVPLRFEDGKRDIEHRGSIFRWPKVIHKNVEQLYALSVYMPRFQNLGPRDKLATLVHELYHISPHFNGDLRRFPGKNFAHGESRESYDEALLPVVNELEQKLDLDRYPWLRKDFAGLRRLFPSISGLNPRGMAPVYVGKAVKKKPEGAAKEPDAEKPVAFLDPFDEADHDFFGL
ncbi:MAG: hypothetical protein NUW37_05625 [Planctomycetes bacterium]|nr:hypothetical protein [Planctomycetota bacterium]